MNQVLKYFECKFPKCENNISFDLKEMVKGNNKVECSKCGIVWEGTCKPKCCGSVQVSFVGMLKGKKIKSFNKVFK